MVLWPKRSRSRQKATLEMAVDYSHLGKYHSSSTPNPGPSTPWALKSCFIRPRVTRASVMGEGRQGEREVETPGGKEETCPGPLMTFLPRHIHPLFWYYHHTPHNRQASSAYMSRSSQLVYFSFLATMITWGWIFLWTGGCFQQRGALSTNKQSCEVTLWYLQAKPTQRKTDASQHSESRGK